MSNIIGTSVPCHMMHLINQLLRKLQSSIKDKYAYNIYVLSQLIYHMFLRKAAVSIYLPRMLA
jgi:hypothetical protein